jgi:hypothetical protein
VPVAVNTKCDFIVTDVSEWGIKTFKHWLPAVGYFKDSGTRYKVNYLLLLCWALVRSENYTTKEYNDNKDVFRLGGRFNTYREAIDCGASELAKFTSSDMLQEQVAVEKLYKEATDFLTGLPPAVEPPPPPVVVTPPPPPVAVPEPVEPPPVAGEPVPWRKSMAWIGGLASGLLAVWGLASMFLPGSVSTIGRMVLEALKALFGG